jgi:hypothetical protein
LKIGLVAYSFALGKTEPNPKNILLAEEVERTVKEETALGNEVAVVSQWEIAEALKIKPFHVVRQKEDYLDSDMVTAEASEVFHQQGVTQVIVVANPFLHLWLCRSRVQKAGFEVIKKKIKKIGFYKDSLQWWTRGPIRLIFYLIRMKLTGKRG